jgi:uncharacterized membrane protein YidH (DUF202 family)
MSAVDTGFLILLLMLTAALAITNFAQARTNMKTQYQNYFGLIFLIAFVFLMVSGWKSMSQQY